MLKCLLQMLVPTFHFAAIGMPLLKVDQWGVFLLIAAAVPFYVIGLKVVAARLFDDPTARRYIFDGTHS